MTNLLNKPDPSIEQCDKLWLVQCRNIGCSLLQYIIQLLGLCIDTLIAIRIDTKVCIVVSIHCCRIVIRIDLYLISRLAAGQFAIWC